MSNSPTIARHALIEEHYTIGEVAKHLHVSKSTIRKWIANEVLIAHTIDDTRCVRIGAKDLAHFEEKQLRRVVPRIAKGHQGAPSGAKRN